MRHSDSLQSSLGTGRTDRVVYEKNLSLKTASIARRMTVFNPDDSWKTP